MPKVFKILYNFIFIWLILYKHIYNFAPTNCHWHIHNEHMYVFNLGWTLLYSIKPTSLSSLSMIDVHSTQKYLVWIGKPSKISAQRIIWDSSTQAYMYVLVHIYVCIYLSTYTKICYHVTKIESRKQKKSSWQYRKEQHSPFHNKTKAIHK